MYRSTAIRWIRILAAAFVAAVMFAYLGPFMCSRSQSWEQVLFGDDTLGIVALGTDWCVAKMLFTTTACMMPNPSFLYLQPVQNYLRTFVREGLAREYTGTGKSIFASGSDEQHSAKHSITISATQTRYKSVVRLFGSAWWRFSCDLKPVRAPLQKGFTIEMLNPFGSEGSMVLAKVTPL